MKFRMAKDTVSAQLLSLGYFKKHFLEVKIELCKTEDAQRRYQAQGSYSRKMDQSATDVTEERERVLYAYAHFAILQRKFRFLNQRIIFSREY